MQCVQCGSTLRATAKICIHCGTPVGAAPSPAPAPAPVPAPAPAPEPVAATPAPQEPVDAPVAAPAVQATVESAPQPSAPQAAAEAIPEPAVEPEPAPETAPEPATEVSTPAVEAKRPQVEVAPEFAATPLPVPPVKPAATASASKMPLMIGGGVVVAVLAGAGIFMSGKSESPPPAEVKAKTAPVAGSAPQTSAPMAAAAGAAIDRQWLNQLMGLAANNDWGSVQTKLEQAQPTVPAAVDKAAARQLNTQAINALRSGDVQGAVTLFTQAAAQDPGDPEIQNNLGYAYLQAGRLEEARQYLLQTLQLAPTRAQAWVNTADLFAQSGNAEVAQSALKLAVFFATDRAKALASLSREENLGHEQFKATAKAVVAQADRIPAYKR